MKKIIFLIIGLLCFIMPVSAKEKVKAYVFCKDDEEISSALIEYLEDLKEEDDYFDIVVYKVWDKDWNEDYNLLNVATSVADYFGQVLQGSPYLVIGNKYSLDTYTIKYDDEIEEALIDAYNDETYEDIVSKMYDKEQKRIKSSNLWTIGIVSVFTIVFVGIIILSRKNVNE